MTHAGMVEAKTCGVPIRHHCGIPSDYQASILKHSDLRDNDYAYVWESPDHALGTCCEPKADTTIHALQPAAQNKSVVHYCAALPKDSAILHDVLTASFPPPNQQQAAQPGSGTPLSTFQTTKHFFDTDPDVVPSATLSAGANIQTLDRFHRFPPCDDCERTRLGEKDPPEGAGVVGSPAATVATPQSTSCAVDDNDISPDSI